MHQRITLGSQGIDDPAARMATGMRQFVRRAHDEPLWTRFILRYSYSAEALKGMFLGPPAQDLADALLRALQSKNDPDQDNVSIAVVKPAIP